MVKVMCEVQLKDRNRAEDINQMLGLNEVIDQKAMTYSVHWYGHLLMLRMAISCERLSRSKSWEDGILPANDDCCRWPDCQWVKVNPLCLSLSLC